MNSIVKTDSNFKINLFVNLSYVTFMKRPSLEQAYGLSFLTHYASALFQHKVPSRLTARPTIHRQPPSSPRGSLASLVGLLECVAMPGHS